MLESTQPSRRRTSVETSVRGRTLKLCGCRSALDVGTKVAPRETQQGLATPLLDDPVADEPFEGEEPFAGEGTSAEFVADAAGEPGSILLPNLDGGVGMGSDDPVRRGNVQRAGLDGDARSDEANRVRFNRGFELVSETLTVEFGDCLPSGNDTAVAQQDFAFGQLGRSDSIGIVLIEGGDESIRGSLEGFELGGIWIPDGFFLSVQNAQGGHWEDGDPKKWREDGTEHKETLAEPKTFSRPNICRRTRGGLLSSLNFGRRHRSLTGPSLTVLASPGSCGSTGQRVEFKVLFGQTLSEFFGR